ncbi:MAG: hypothetical protein AABM67_21560 [Acidobacteriota bacterium]
MSFPRITLAMTLAALVLPSCFVLEASAQRRGRQRSHFAVCGNPNLPCKSYRPFEPFELPFRLPENAVIWDTELFYALILKSMKAPADNCDVFVPESERIAAQALFPNNKVFATRCFEPGGISYTNTSANAQFMAVYAGTTLADANRIIAAVKATGKFPGANLRRMRATVNGT